MSALGELFIWIIYALLCIPTLAIILILIADRKRHKSKRLIYLLISLLPVSLFAYHQHSEHRQQELKYVGVYYLTTYPSCNSCTLHLNKDNTYEVHRDSTKIEHGNWSYRSGSDYWIVDIGESGQLGSGNYTYITSENGH
ncbi:hypothetical protein [uncultured Psychroserpens sp.]|uniref:hypothetical protein n=1 Tax=uncultured Psychroserpens sp. TaxID=255436 RepID=UPI00260514B0|nr:hypothetical protein [uncultured Psychroserpens sp.]